MHSGTVLKPDGKQRSDQYRFQFAFLSLS